MRSAPLELGAPSERGNEAPISAPALAPSLLGTRRGFLAFLAGLFATHVVLRLLASPLANLDESEQLVLSQAWQWGYGPQPPLYTWLQIIVFHAFGPSILGLAVLKNALLFGTYAFTYASARLVMRTHVGGMMAALSLLFIPQIAWESQRDLTHSVLATTVAAATLFILLKLKQERARSLYLLLGLAFGLGLLSNYSYALLIAGLLCSALCVREFRGLVLTPWFLATAAIALLLVLPHALWAREHAPLVLASAHKLRIHPDASALVNAVTTVANLAAAWISHVISLVLIVAVLCWKQFRPFPREVLRRPEIRFLWLLLATALAAVLASMFATGATAFKGRWLQPIYFCLPILLIALVHQRLTRAAARRVVNAALAAALLVMVALQARAWLPQNLGRREELNTVFPELAAQIQEQLARARVTAADTFLIGGNLRLMFPHTLVVTPQFAPASPNPAGTASLFVFNATFSLQPSAELKEFVSASGVTLDTENIRYIAPLARSRQEKHMRLGVVTPGSPPPTSR